MLIELVMIYAFSKLPCSIDGGMHDPDGEILLEYTAHRLPLG
jgi:hypothetical protein